MDNFDFWYAVNNTEVVRSPRRGLETFGTTLLNYHLVSELLDSVDQVRVREGRIEAVQPQIITPSDFGDLPLEGFQDAEAGHYVDWLRDNLPHLRLIQYGFNIKKQDVKSFVVSENKEQVLENVTAVVEAADDPLSAIVLGVDKPWEVCLLKLMVDMVEQSAPQNVQDFQQSQMLPSGPGDVRREIEEAFLAASKDANLISELHKLLDRHELFREYEDRFFALVRASQS